MSSDDRRAGYPDWLARAKQAFLRWIQQHGPDPNQELVEDESPLSLAERWFQVLDGTEPPMRPRVLSGDGPGDAEDHPATTDCAEELVEDEVPRPLWRPPLVPRVHVERRSIS